MSSLMFRPVAAVTEGLGASSVLTSVGSLPGVGSLMYLQILQPRERLLAPCKLNFQISDLETGNLDLNQPALTGHLFGFSPL